MATYSVKNENPGARGVGGFLIEAGASLDVVELTEDEALLLGELDGVTVKEVDAKALAAAATKAKNQADKEEAERQKVAADALEAEKPEADDVK